MRLLWPCCAGVGRFVFLICLLPLVCSGSCSCKQSAEERQQVEIEERRRWERHKRYFNSFRKAKPDEAEICEAAVRDAFPSVRTPNPDGGCLKPIARGKGDYLLSRMIRRVSADKAEVMIRRCHDWGGRMDAIYRFVLTLNRREGRWVVVDRKSYRHADGYCIAGVRWVDQPNEWEVMFGRSDAGNK